MPFRYTLHPTTSSGKRISMQWDAENDPTQEEIDAYDTAAAPESTTPNHNSYNENRVDSNVIGFDHAKMADVASKLPRPLQYPVAFTGSLLGGIAETLSAPESIASMGAGRMKIPAPRPPAIPEPLPKVNLPQEFAPTDAPVRPRGAFGPDIADINRPGVYERLKGERGAVGPPEEPPPPKINVETPEEIAAKTRRASILAKAQSDPEFMKLSKGQKDIVLRHLEGADIPPQKLPKVGNIEPPVSGTAAPQPANPQFTPGGLVPDRELDIMKQPSMFHPNASPVMKDVPPLEPEAARISTRIGQSDLFPGRVEPFTEKAIDVLHGSRELMASGDLSAPFRQAAFMVGRKEFWKNIPGMIKAGMKETNYVKGMSEIESRPSFGMMQNSGLAFTDLGKNMGNREERFMSRLVGNLPVVGQSARAYTYYLNKVRADVFDSIVNKARGLKMNPDEFQKMIPELSNYINAASGRGSLGALEHSAKGLNSVFFAPRLAASRLKLLNPYTYVNPNTSAFVRKEALADLAKFTTIGSTMLGLAKAAGADVELDPRSADFGKAKFGNTRFDMFGGFTQYLRLGSQLVLNSTKSTNTGKVRGLGSTPVVPTKLDTIYTFLQNKEAPIPSFLTGFLSGKDYKGDPFNVPSEVLQRFTPMILQDAYEVYQNDPELLPYSIPASGFGIGVQSYKPKVKNRGPKPYKFKSDAHWYDDLMSGAYVGSAGR